jgi:hypothetical protein
MASGGPGNKLDVVADFVCEIFSFAKFPFGLEPKLFIPSYRPVVFFPDFPGAFSDFIFVGLCHSAVFAVSAPLSGPICAELFPNLPPTAQSRGTYWPSREGGRPSASDPHCTLSIILDDGDLNLFNGLVLAPGTGGHICELFAENPHWRERLTDLSRLYADALNVAMEGGGGGTDD